jgi:hypothetical protein
MAATILETRHVDLLAEWISLKTIVGTEDDPTDTQQALDAADRVLDALDILIETCNSAQQMVLHVSPAASALANLIPVRDSVRWLRQQSDCPREFVAICTRACMCSVWEILTVFEERPLLLYDFPAEVVRRRPKEHYALIGEN